MMGQVIKVAALALLGTVCAVLLKKATPEIGLVLALLTGVCILFQAASGLEGIIVQIKTLAALAQLENNVVEPVMKTVGIAVVTKVTSELCRGAGESGIAAFAETAGTALALAAALPLLREVLVLMAQLME